jgi:asparagine synthase (glutamine-hydrolysing)
MIHHCTVTWNNAFHKPPSHYRCQFRKGVPHFCGIAGYAGTDDESLLKAMIASLRHRGPDDTGFFTDQGIGLASARLSIIDIEGGHQPIHNEDGTINVVYNGEIYNFNQLRADLSSKGHRFYTRSDTEVIVHSYEQYGESFVTKLNGMFAIALWDAKKRKLLLARDRMGIKPLYYTAGSASTILFASEIKAILQAHVARAVDQEGLADILNLGYIPGNKTLLAGILKLPPATILVYESGSLRTESYWNIPPVAEHVDEDESVRKLSMALEDAVRDQLVADVPVGCFLSGGLDTSTIVAYASKASRNQLKTFCMGFGEETDEFHDARLIAERFGTDHHELMVDSSQGMKLYPKMVWHIEAPKYNLYPWFVCEQVRRYVKVCLSGNGGDEIAGGYYARYANALKIAELSRSPFSRLLKLGGAVLESTASNPRTRNKFRALRLLGNNAEEYLLLAGAFPDSFNRKLFRTGAQPFSVMRNYYDEYFRNTDFLDGLMRAELRTKLVDDLLSVDDGMSMAHSLELRVPLLDNRLVDLLAPIPWENKYSPGKQGKLLLRKAVRDMLPDESFRKPKWGFSVNVLSWYRGELGELIQQVLPESDVMRRYFSPHLIERLLEKTPAEQNRRYQVLLWQLLGFHLWHRIFIDNDPSNAPKLELNALVA